MAYDPTIKEFIEKIDGMSKFGDFVLRDGRIVFGLPYVPTEKELRDKIAEYKRAHPAAFE